MKTFLFVAAFILLFAIEILRVYLIMPFPGSQHRNTISLAYWIANNIMWIRIVALLLVINSVVPLFKRKRKLPKIMASVFLVLYVVVFYFFNFRFEADRMFYEPRHKAFASAETDTTSKSKLVIGVVMNGEAKAYPIEVIGYHHQVRDSIGNEPVMVTYCTVCRTGRVFSPFVNDKNETFRLVGMDHFNAMFEDVTTKSWWQQATGVAIAGPLKGKTLKEIPSRQLPLAVWLRQYPNSLVLQPDSSFKKQYHDLAGFDKGTIKSSLEKRDSLSWKRKSWIVGVVNGNAAKAYDWNDLARKRFIQDSIPGLPIVLVMENDTVTFHAYNRMINNSALQFTSLVGDSLIKDDTTGSLWNMDGLCIQGPMAGTRLANVAAYNEFWHSWQTFHPNTLR